MKTKLSLLSLTLGLGLALASVWLLGRGAVTVTAAPQRPDATVRYVDSGGTCGGQTPCYSTIQAAVDAAQAGDTIKVATGVYTGVQARPAPTGYPNPPAGGLITQVVYISETVTVRGGYTTADWNTSDPDANPTTLDAEGLGRVMVIAGEISPTVEGLRLTGGDASGLEGTSKDGRDGGGGMYVISATATISNNRVFSNTAHYGGGLFLWYSDSTLTGNTVTSNTVRWYGGGLYMRKSAATLTGNTVSHNTSQWGSGGLYLGGSDVTLTGNTVSYNTADDWEGGGLGLYGSDATLIGNTVSHNNSWGSGGGLYLSRSDATLTGNTVSYNTTWGNGHGGGLYLWESDATLTGNTVSHNTSHQGGGGLRLSDSDATLIGNTIYSNTAENDNGGGLLLSGSATLINNVIADNRLRTNISTNFKGSGLYVYKAPSLRLLHNTIARNTEGDGSGICLGALWGTHATIVLTNTILVSHTVGITVEAGCTATLESTLWGAGAWANGSDTGGAGTINTNNDYHGDPAFKDPAAHDYHLTSGSAAVDKGIDAGVITDKDGIPRPQGPAPDLGAYEFMSAEQYTLTVKRTGTGTGTVTSRPIGINCGADCDQSYSKDTTVMLMAAPAPGSFFAGWSGDCTGSGPATTVKMDANKTCTATFNLAVILTVKKAGSGNGTVTSNPAGIDCGVDCSESYPPNTTVTLTATADAGSLFSGWGGDCVGTDPNTVVTVDVDKTCIATFDRSAPVGGTTQPVNRPTVTWPWPVMGLALTIGALGAAALLRRRRA